jgi:hypothetical protein
MNLFARLSVPVAAFLISLTAHAQTPTATPAPEMAPAAAFVSSITPFGDLRYRYENVFNEAPGTKAATYDHHRMRARVGVKAKPTDDTTIEFRLATGAGGTSTNQSFGDGTANGTRTAARGMKNYAINLDRAWFKYAPIESMWVAGGRMSNPFIVVGDNDLIWDADLNYDGLVLAHDCKMGSLTLFGRLGEFILEEAKDSTTAIDRKFDSVEVGARVNANDQLQIAGTVSNHSFINIKGHTGVAAPTDFSGNTNDGTNYSEDFNVLAVGLEVTYDFGLPLTFFGEYAKNNKASTANVATIAGLRLNKLKDAGDWMVAIDRRELQQDSTLGAFADSDSLGGGTDGRSIRLTGGYNVSKAFGVQLTAYNGTKGIGTGETEVRRDRYQADLNFRF